jgi:hypothetical protein
MTDLGNLGMALCKDQMVVYLLEYKWTAHSRCFADRIDLATLGGAVRKVQCGTIHEVSSDNQMLLHSLFI